MGDARDLCPHLDFIGEVTKDDLLLKSKVKGQTSWGCGPHPGLCVGEAQMFLEQWKHWLLTVSAHPFVQMEELASVWELCPTGHQLSFRPVHLGATRPVISCLEPVHRAFPRHRMNQALRLRGRFLYPRDLRIILGGPRQESGPL